MKRDLTSQRRWIVAQVGSREHYAAPRILARRGQLDRLYTDVWVPRGQRILSRLGGPFHSLAGRYHEELARAPVTAFNAGGIARIVRERWTSPGPAGYLRFVETGQWFSRKLTKCLRAHPPDPKRHAVYLFSTIAFEALQYLREQGVPTLLVQPDVARVEYDIVREESRRWPGWDLWGTADIPEPFFERLEKEWATADGIIVNSNWSRDGLMQQGVPSEKIHVIPMPYEAPAAPPLARTKSDRPFRVLWLGQLNLRKGLPYLFDAARQLADRNVMFDVVGPAGITAQALATAPANVRLAGPVPRGAVGEWYRQADLFVLPTLCDGFAVTQVEAMNFGLPVITTERCGDVVADGVSGVIVPPGDADALAAAIGNLVADPAKLLEMSAAAIARARDFSLDRFGDALDVACDQVLDKKSGDQ